MKAIFYVFELVLQFNLKTEIKLTNISGES
jgi:hypothetical protein